MPTQDKQVLLVDDDPDDLDLYVNLFNDIDPNIATVRYKDPVKAISYLRTSKQLPDLTILDFNMPKLTGLDFLKLVRADDKLGRLPVAVVTTGCDPKTTEALIALGVECHQKAPDFHDFRELLERILQTPNRIASKD